MKGRKWYLTVPPNFATVASTVWVMKVIGATRHEQALLSFEGEAEHALRKAGGGGR
jgi:hypothetical protein